MNERQIKPGHIRAAKVLAPLCREMERTLHVDHSPTLDHDIAPGAWAQTWLQRLEKAAVRAADGINRLGEAAEADSEAVTPEVEPALDGIVIGVRALVILHDEAARTVPLNEPFLRNDLMGIGADVIRQFLEFLDGYVTTVEDPDTAGNRIEMRLELLPPPGIEMLAHKIRQDAAGGCHSGSDLLLVGLLGVGLGLWMGGE